MRQNKSTNPLYICFLGAVRVMLNSYAIRLPCLAISEAVAQFA